MGFFDNLFGKKESRPAAGAKDQGYTEKQNLGTRQDTSSKATAYWISRMKMTRKDPFVMYTFQNENDARAALLDLPCIHVAVDSQALICTQVLIFGYYQADDVYEAIICGEDLTHSLWQQARESFEKHGGTYKNDLEPVKKEAATAAPNKVSTKSVRFVREDRVEDQWGTSIYRTYKGPDAETAKAFLAENPVTKKLFYIVVETPEGNYGRDIDGIYKE